MTLDAFAAEGHTHTRKQAWRLLQASGPLSDRSWEDQSSDFECTVKENEERGSQGRTDRETKH